MIADGFVYTSSENHAQMTKMSRLNLHLLFLAFGIGANIASAQTSEPAPGTYTVLHSFSPADGVGSSAPLVQATNGDFYGTAPDGGSSSCYSGNSLANECGTLFRITPAGVLTALYDFCSQGCSDGSGPYEAPVQASNGYMYGTTLNGGVTCVASGCGTIFKASLDGNATTLYRFCAQAGCPDGFNPFGGLVQAASGDLYGTTFGSLGSCMDDPAGTNCGTVFKITPSGALTTLYTFCTQSGCADGTHPYGGMIQATNGDFYGTTENGGNNNPACSFGCGTIFRITPAGSLTTLYSFCSKDGCADGLGATGLVLASNGDLYGTTGGGGAGVNCPAYRTSGCGTVFRITPGGILTTLHNFCSSIGCADGYEAGALIQAANGDYYGTTVEEEPSAAARYSRSLRAGS